MAEKLKPKEIKTIFTDIVRGYTVAASEKHGKVYIKHLNSFDSADIDTERSLYETKAREMGVQTSEEYSKVLQEQDIWTEENETKITQLKINSKT